MTPINGIKKLSRYRRHRWAAPALMVVALLSVGTTFSIASGATPSATDASMNTSQSVRVSEGRQIFL